jgi:hypothetical protein
VSPVTVPGMAVGYTREGHELVALQAPDLAPIVDVIGALPRPAAIARQRGADALLLVTLYHRSMVPGKLFGYLTAATPILAHAGDSEAARIVRETRSGDVVARDGTTAIPTGCLTRPT